MKTGSLLLLIFVTCLTTFGRGEESLKRIPYYQRPGTFMVHISNYMFHKEKPVTLPVNFNPEATVFRNFTLGLVFTHFQFKNRSSEGSNATRWTGSNIKYNQFLVGIKSNYHLNPMIESIFNKSLPNEIMDIYLSSWMGYSFVLVKNPDADQDLINRNKKVRGGVGLGVRSMVFPWLGFSLEGGYSSFGYASFGITFVLN